MKLSSQNITVKSIIVKRFELNLKQTPKGKYYILISPRKGVYK